MNGTPNASVNRITNGNVYLGQNNLLGKVEDINLDAVKAKMEEVKSLGLVGTYELFSGFDKFGGKIKWNSFYPQYAKQTANPYVPVTLQVRSSIETHSSLGMTRTPMVTILTVRFNDNPLGQWQQHQNVPFESGFTTLAVKQMVAGETIFEIDVLNNIFIVDGEDLLAQYRAHIGAN